MYLDHSTYAPPPSRFEPGTPAIAEAIGLGAAADYLQDIGMQNVQDFEQDLGGYLYERVRDSFSALPDVPLYHLHSPPQANQAIINQQDCDHLRVLLGMLARPASKART